MSEKIHVSVSKFKSKALQYFEEIGHGQGSIIVTKHGKPLAQVIPFSGGTQKAYKPGTLKNLVLKEEDITTPLGPHIWKAAK